MKIKSILIASISLLSILNISAQHSSHIEVNVDSQGSSSHNYSQGYGNTLNLGVGLGGYLGNHNYYGNGLPVLDINYEFGITRNITLAPFLSYYSYSDKNYREVVTPIGVKGTVYLDQLLHAGSSWDFYVAGSLGVAITNTTWDANYYGNRTYYQERSPLYLDFHLGAEYLITRKLGIFLDLSSGISTIGLALH